MDQVPFGMRAQRDTTMWRERVALELKRPR
jgi:hypothetical protein